MKTIKFLIVTGIIAFNMMVVSSSTSSEEQYTEFHGIKTYEVFSADEVIQNDNDGDGYFENQADCDDNDATIYPGAIEICEDGIDQNCDGKDEACIDTFLSAIDTSSSVPTGVAASDNTVQGEVIVTWTPATSATSYDVYRADMPAWTGTAPKRIASSITGTSYDDTTAVSGNRYYYWVKSRNSDGVSKYSNFDPGYWGSMGSIPEVPTGASATDGTVSGKVNITWNATSNTLVYEIWRADIPAFLGGNIKKIGTSTTNSYDDATVVNGNQYYYWVKARNSWGVSRYSKFDTGYIGSASSPLPAPTGVSATYNTVSGKVNITWNAISGALVYEIWRATKLVSEGGKPVRIGFLSDTTFDDSTSTQGITYYYWVKARDSWGSSKYGLSEMFYYFINTCIDSKMEYTPIDPFLATSAPNSLYVIPVMIIRYLPTTDCINLDVSKCPDYWDLGEITLSELISNIDQIDKRVKFSLEEGSKFHGYKSSEAIPSIGYQVIEYITVYEHTPAGKKAPGSNTYFPDFHSIFNRLNVEHYVNDLGVKEIWFWQNHFDDSFPSYDPAIHDPEDFRTLNESNMASLTTGDISNSWRESDDLPIYNHTYIVYGQNFRRSQAEAVHNHGHQLEAMFAHVNWLQVGNTDLFWKKFVGQNNYENFITGRCGWTHMPPNTTNHYDYLNSSFVESDIEDWRPDGSGSKTWVNVNTWGNLVFAWPEESEFSQRKETQWYIYWMQNMPGYKNNIPYGSMMVTNWWEFVADWDKSIDSGMGLYGY